MMVVVRRNKTKMAAIAMATNVFLASKGNTVRRLLIKNKFCFSSSIRVIKRENGIAQLSMNRGPVNTLSSQFMIEINETFFKIEKDCTIKACILSSDCRAFSAGLDLKEIYNSSAHELHSFWEAFQILTRTIHNSHLYTVAAIEGHAIAAGCILTLCCDYRVISSTAKIGLNETIFGMLPPRMSFNIITPII
jgi:3,2-trans-enoyl-CoA isomerase